MAEKKISTIYSVARENRIARQEALREKLKGLEYLRQLDEIDKELKLGTKTIEITRKKRVKRKRVLVTEAITLPLNAVDVQRLRARADIQRMRLAKVLPDLKSVEVHDDGRGESQEDWVLRKARERGLLKDTASPESTEKPALNS